eukprot:TRINITY_DN40903_c0_g1_i1.p1 TRINITY_DN40903_c0_g1~~TRINITY_DN40903_c0_g1_i1.p1  ORF type:complete len:513 (-),score=58.13 TRINITY_DN40903_c0_g1_i1:135-1673(-)
MAIGFLVHAPASTARLRGLLAIPSPVEPMRHHPVTNLGYVTLAAAIAGFFAAFPKTSRICSGLRRGSRIIHRRAAYPGTSAEVEATSRRRFQWSKWLTFWSCFFGYSVAYFTRQSLSYTAPALKKAMGWNDLSQLGQLSSLFPLAYGSSRFIGGVLGDRMSPKKVFALGLAVCGMLNVAFGLSSSMPFFVAIWFLNGCFQGLAAPPCVKLITNWFDPKERGFWWSGWHASINLGGFLIPFLSGGLADAYGWRYGMLAPGGLGLVAAGLSLVLMRDGPETTETDLKVKADLSVDMTTQGEGSIQTDLLLNPTQWAIGLSYLLVYVCRQGLGIWGIFFLLNSGTVGTAKAAALFSGFELGGFLGNLSAGALSDRLLRLAPSDEHSPGQRVKVVAAYFLATVLLLPLFAWCPARLPLLQYVLLMGLGHFLCGAQLLLPLVAAEVAPKNLVSTATGFVGFVGYFGAALSGLPLSIVVQRFGWNSYIAVLTIAAALGVCLVWPMRNLHSWRRRLTQD